LPGEKNTKLFHTFYGLDSLGRIKELTEVIAGDTNIFEYDYDDVGRLLAVIRNDTTISGYIYNSNSNRLSHTAVSGTITATYENKDRLPTYGNTSYNYNLNGELLEKIEGTDTTRYFYDNLGNLLQVVLPNSDVIDYIIDAKSRRVGRQVNGSLEKQWLYHDQLNPVAELDETGQLVTRFVYAIKGHVPSYMIKAGATYRIISDHLGSVRQVVNIATGDNVQRMDYDEFGNVLVDSNPEFQPFGYAGGLYDNITGLVRFGVRDYDAGVGRWTAKDPIGFGGGDLGLYNYCHASPLNNIDPSGLRLWLRDNADPKYVARIAQAINHLNQHGAAGEIARLHARDEIFYIEPGFPEMVHSEGTIYWDPFIGAVSNIDRNLSPSISLVHEASHALRFLVDPCGFFTDSSRPHPVFQDYEEMRVALGAETDAARRTGEIGPNEISRNHYGPIGAFTHGPTTGKAWFRFLNTE
jgi:RHS repeat-associated protein